MERRSQIFIITLLTIFFLGGCAIWGPSPGTHEAFVYSYEEVAFHLQLTKEIITSLHGSGDLTGEKYEAAKSAYNQAVDMFKQAGEIYKKYLTAPDIPTAKGFRAQYQKLMLELTKVILEINAKIKGGAA